ncbi:MAG: hypothetical protein IT324_00720 [Anaerolineae bacterium]|nr:hypothetical protein [Anaerolineae bacterium]
MFTGKRLVAGVMLVLALTALLVACSSPAAPTGGSGAANSGAAASNSTDGSGNTSAGGNGSANNNGAGAGAANSAGGTSGTGNTGAADNGTPASQPTQVPLSGSTPGSNGNVAPGAPAQPTTQSGNGGSIAVPPTFTSGAPGNGNTGNRAGGTSGTGGTGANGGAQPSGTAVAEAIPGALDPCSLVTPADIQAAVGFPVQAGRRSNDQNGGASCQFIGTQDNTNTVGITVYQGNQEVTAAQQNMGGAQAQAVPGLGDEAFFVNNGLYVRYGNNLFSVGVAAPNQQNQGQNQVMNAAVALARRIIVKLSPVI